MDYTTLVSTLKQERHETEANDMVIEFLNRKTANLADTTYHDLDPLKWIQLAEEFNIQLLSGKTKSEVYKNSVLLVDTIFGENSNITHDLKIYFAEKIVMQGVSHVEKLAKDTVDQAKDIFNQFDADKLKEDFKRETAEAVTTATAVFSGLKASMGKFRNSFKQTKDDENKPKM
jgi:hypothetical protein